MYVDSDGVVFIKEKVLSKEEAKLLSGVVRDKRVVEALKKVLLVPVYHNGVLKPDQEADMTRNFMLSITNRRELTNEEMGAQARSIGEAVALLEIGFSYLENLDTPDIKVERKLNDAR